jgi:5,10-methylenetetrahydromethanopterin reductase
MAIERQLGLSVVAKDITQVRSYVEQTEKAGFDLMGFGDSQCVRPDMFVECTLCAAFTKRIRFGPRVTNPVTRHLAILANAMASINALSGGRAVLGIGSGDSAVYQVGLRPARLAEFEAALVALRNLFENRAAEYKGKTFRLEWPVSKCPIFVAACGPKTLELAGRLGDGVIISNGMDKAAVEESLTHIDSGARQSGRTVDDLEIWWSVGVGISKENRIAPQLAGMAAAYANQAFRFTMQSKAVPAKFRDRLVSLQERYDFYNHMTTSSSDYNAHLLDDEDLRQYLYDRFLVVGTTEDCIEKIARVRSYGVKNLWLTMPLEEKDDFFKAWREKVAPHL